MLWRSSKFENARFFTGVYVNQTRSTHHEGFCSIAGMQYRISSTSHTQTAATAVAAELHDQVSDKTLLQIPPIVFAACYKGNFNRRNWNSHASRTRLWVLCLPCKSRACKEMARLCRPEDTRHSRRLINTVSLHLLLSIFMRILWTIVNNVSVRKMDSFSCRSFKVKIPVCNHL